MGFNEESGLQIRSQILTIEPLSSCDKIFKMIQQEKNHKKLMSSRLDLTKTKVAFIISLARKAQCTIAQKAACKYCGHFRHEEPNRYKIIGILLNGAQEEEEEVEVVVVVVEAKT